MVVIQALGGVRVIMVVRVWDPRRGTGKMVSLAQKEKAAAPERMEQ